MTEENLAVSVSIDPDTGDVKLAFGEAIQVTVMAPDQARQLAKILLLTAQAAEDVKPG